MNDRKIENEIQLCQSQQHIGVDPNDVIHQVLQSTNYDLDQSMAIIQGIYERHDK